MSEVGSVDDDISFDTMFIVGSAARSNQASRWISDDAGLGVIDRMVTSTGDNLVWSS